MCRTRSDYIFHHAFEVDLFACENALEMATNDPRVPPEVQQKIRELEEELNDGKWTFILAQERPLSAVDQCLCHGVGDSCVVIMDILDWHIISKLWELTYKYAAYVLG